jgi:hypothetical protein
MPISPSTTAKPVLTFPRRIYTWFTGEKEPSAWEPSHQYCDRLLHIYWKLSASDGDRPSRLVSEVPLWAQDAIAAIGHDVKKGIAALEAVPRLQAALADCTAYTPAKWLLEKELAARSFRPGSTQPTWNGTGDVYDAASEAQLAGLAFSGGGIRSATFALGILQALASRNQLKRFDYLSTVSGGGYIHQWLASWIYNEPGRLTKVQELLKPLPEAGSPARMPSQIQWLRRYSSYLTPQDGFFSADTWTMLCIWFRNTFLNQIVLFGFLASCLLAIRGALYPFFSTKPYAIARITPFHLGPICLGLYLLFASITLARALYAQRASARHENGPPSRRKPKPGPLTPPVGAIGNAGVLWRVVLPTFILAVYAGLIAHRPLGPSTRLFFEWLWPGAILLLLLAVIFGGLWPSDPTKWKEMEVVVMVLSILSAVGFVAGVRYVAIHLVSSAHQHLSSRLTELCQCFAGAINLAFHLPLSKTIACTTVYQNSDVCHVFTNSSSIRLVTTDMLFAILVPIVFFALQFMAIRLLIGVMGHNLSESRSEWMARFGAWSGLFGAVWLILSSIAMLAPTLCDWMLTRSFWHRVSALVSVLAIHAGTLYAGSSGKSNGKPKAGALFGYSAFDLLGMIGAPVCVLSLLVILSGIVERGAAAANNMGANSVGIVVDPYKGLLQVFYLGAAIVVIFLFFGWRVDVNQFSMHGFYRNRLARCYLGGTNPSRTADPFTGFDDHAETRTKTGVKISSLLPARFSSDPKKEYDGPFPIFCATLNLTFGEDLAYQERKGTSFAFTPLYSGYHVGWTSEKSSTRADTTFNGYAPTANYAYRKGGITLAECAAVSGAALNPNQGVNTQPALAFLMTLFNARLGWWLANPRKPRIWPSENRSPTPWFGLRYLLGELFGMADDTSKFVCLSDGGQFENMGLYELVRRRCSFIVVCDAEADTDYNFQGIGGAIAKCRLDFGAEITLPLENLRPCTRDPWFSGMHFVEGTIRYPAPPDGRLPEYIGSIFYLKTTITGKETGDILHYRLAHPTFPNDTTLNQWFTESQFESYRRLGQLIGEEAIARFPQQNADR